MRDALNIVFESGRLSYSDYEVDLYNSGINQILSLAASRGHKIYHFSMDDIFSNEGRPFVRVSFLELRPGWEKEPLEAHKYLESPLSQHLPLDYFDMFFVRGDDIKQCTKEIELLKQAEKKAIFLENIEDTLSTTDKYELIRRCPDVPMPVTFKADTLEEALGAIHKLPEDDGKFVLKDRFGCGCGEQVHLISFEDPKLEEVVNGHINDYYDIIVQEFCPEVAQGDLVVTYFDQELIAPMRRLPREGEWRTNASLGGKEIPAELSPELERIASSVIGCFPGCRYSSVDMLDSGKVLEINAFPGGKGLYKNYGIRIGEIIFDRLEAEHLSNNVP